MRKVIKNQLIGLNPDFNYRGTSQSRIEALSDGVFALAIALLVLSSSVPEGFEQLIVSLEDLVPFAICITLLIVIWYEHYLFFIRFGLQNTKVVVMNTILLFLVLFYVYPLKFLFKVLYKLFYIIFTGDQTVANKLFTETLKLEDGPVLMIVYGVGAASIFFILSWMNRYALSKKIELGLTKKEQFDTRSSIYNNMIMGAIPLFSALLASSSLLSAIDTFTLSGMSYLTYPIAMPVFHIFRKRKRLKLFGVK